MTAQGYEEKRDFARMRIDTVVTYNIKGSSNQAYQGTSQNLSATGLYMTTDNIIDIGTEIELSINASNQLLPPFEADGRVVRCIADDVNASLFHVSIALLNIKQN